MSKNGSSNSSGSKGGSSSPMGNGYGAFNSFKRNNGIQGKGPNSAGQNGNGNNVSNSLEAAKMKAKKQATKKALTTAAKAYNPAVGKAVEKGLETKKGEEYLDEFAKGSTPNQGIRNVVHKIKQDSRKITLIISIVSLLGPVILIMFMCLLFFKQGDSQTYANTNDGKVSEITIKDEYLANVFLNYPGLYEKVEERVEDISYEYGVEVDKYLIIATLIAPIENGAIIAHDNKECGKEVTGEYKKCYTFDNENWYDWDEFLEVWGNQAGLLAKMQIVTDVNIESTKNSRYKEACKNSKYKEDTMEEIAKNDAKIQDVHWWDYLAPVNWFSNNLELWVRTERAQVNARCNVAKKGESEIPDVYSISKERGIYNVIPKDDGTYEYDYDPNSGGVYFWNLLNPGGFITTYLKDSFTYDDTLSDDENYERNLPSIINITNYIYSYYESIRRDCDGVDSMYSTIKKIRVHNVKSRDINRYGEYMDIDLEVYVGCVIMAEHNSSDVAVSESFAIMARTEGVAIVGLDGEGEIENSSNDQNCNLYKYNPTYDPSYENQEDNPNYDPTYPEKNHPAAYKAIQNTRGIVVSEWNDPNNPDNPKIKHTVYDAFCPVDTTPDDGFYYLPDGQRNLPIEEDKVNPAERYLECPCFQNRKKRPGDDDGYAYSSSATEPPLDDKGDPPQDFPTSCWLETGETVGGKYKWRYKPTGGHGSGMSQTSSDYFTQFGYSRYALIKLFFDRDTDYDNVSKDYSVGFKRLESMIDDDMCPNRLVLGEPHEETEEETD